MQPLPGGAGSAMGDTLREIFLDVPISANMELAATEPVELLGVELGMSREQIDDAKVAVLEACINAFQHSCCEDKSVHLRYRIQDSGEKLEIEVRDSGKGFDVDQCLAPTPEGLRKRGHGLKIIHTLMDEVAISSDAQGTKITMVKYK